MSLRSAKRARLRTLFTARGKLLSLMIAHFANDTYANFLPVFLPLLRAKFELTLTLVGLLSSVYTVTASLSQILFGYMADRLSRMNFIALGPLLTGTLMSAVGLMPNYIFVALVLFVSALGTAMFHPQAASVAGSLSKARKGLAVSLFVAAGTFGFAFGPLMMAAFINAFGFGKSYWGVLPLLALAPILFLTNRHENNDAEAGSLKIKDELLQNFKSLFVLWALVVLRHTVFLAFLTFLLILLTERGAGYLMGSLALFAFLFSGAVGGLAGGYLSDVWGRKKIVIASLLLAFPAGLGFLSTSGPIALILLMLTGALLQASNPVIVAQAQEIVPGSAGTASAITMGLGWGVAGLLIGLVGYLADQLGVASALKLVNYAAIGIAIVLAIELYRNPRLR